MRFSELGIDLRFEKQIAHKGITTPTEIQAQAIPTALAGHDIFAQSKTGSGKTLAFLLPAVQRVMKQKALSKRDPRVLIIAPTRELATQVFNECRSLIAGTSMSVVKVLGGENFNDQVKGLRKSPDFVIGTPGRIADHIEERSLFLAGLELLIFDEADRMLDLGFEKQLSTINQAAEHRLRQTLLFSATLDHAQVEVSTRNLLKSPKRIMLSNAHQKHEDIKQVLYFADHLDHKEALLSHFITQENVDQCIIFTATRNDTNRLSELLNKKDIKAISLSGDLAQAKRLDIMEAFSRGIYKVLVTTDVASRGIDLLAISHVINFDLPKQAEEYVHRIGRTGRAGFKGTAISLVGPKDWNSYLAIKNYLDEPLPFDKVEGLEGKFKGFKQKPINKKKPDTNNQKDHKQKPKSFKKKAASKKPKKAIPAPFNVDGMAPLRRKPKPQGDE